MAGPSPSRRWKVAIATASDTTEMHEDGPLLFGALAEVGIDAEARSWGPLDGWDAFDAVFIRATWDYPQKLAEFLGWVDAVAGQTRLANPAPILRWNTDKRYLRNLAAAGVPTIPTVWSEDGQPPEIPDEWDEFVVKPIVSAGGMLSARYSQDRRDEAAAHAAEIVRRGRGAMVQPYLETVDGVGETGTYVFGGEVSHAIRKGGILVPGAAPPEGNDLASLQEVGPREVTAEAAAFARRVVAAVPGGGDQLLYARVDTVADASGSPLLIELEVTEPFLFLEHAPGAAARFAHAAARWLTTTRQPSD